MSSIGESNTSFRVSVFARHEVDLAGLTGRPTQLFEDDDVGLVAHSYSTILFGRRDPKESDQRLECECMGQWPALPSLAKLLPHGWREGIVCIGLCCNLGSDFSPCAQYQRALHEIREPSLRVNPLT